MKKILCILIFTLPFLANGSVDALLNSMIHKNYSSPVFIDYSTNTVRINNKLDLEGELIAALSQCKDSTELANNLDLCTNRDTLYILLDSSDSYKSIWDLMEVAASRFEHTLIVFNGDTLQTSVDSIPYSFANPPSHTAIIRLDSAMTIGIEKGFFPSTCFVESDTDIVCYNYEFTEQRMVWEHNSTGDLLTDGSWIISETTADSYFNLSTVNGMSVESEIYSLDISNYTKRALSPYEEVQYRLSRSFTYISEKSGSHLLTLTSENHLPFSKLYPLIAIAQEMGFTPISFAPLHMEKYGSK